MTISLERFDKWIEHSGPAALVIREHLVPVEGKDAVLFPPTFAAGDKFDGGYNIDTFPDGRNVCLIDSVGSQANRIEPIFAQAKYASLVPQVVMIAGEKRVNLLDAGHRAADAIVRCSQLKQELQDAFKALQDGDAIPLATVAPTSLVFGVWDSRGTYAKVPRLLSSTIRAFDVRVLKRSAQYVPAVDYFGEGLLEEPADKKMKDAYAERGFVHVPASASHGGVIADGGIRRDATLHLAALRLLRSTDDARTRKLRRYILGLALTAFTFPPAGYLRQGCNLVLDPDAGRKFQVVYPDGRREDAAVSHEEALAYATSAAKEFEVGKSREVAFEKEVARKDLSGDTDGGKAGRKPRAKG